MAGVIEKLSKRIKDVHDEDDQKLQRRISKRYSRSGSLPALASNQGSGTLIDEDDFEEDERDLIEDHEKWEHSECLPYHLLGFMIGLGNIWGFPYLMYYNGGSMFLLPYFLFVFLFSYPVVYLELLVGQYTQLGNIASWKVAPLFKGVGICQVIFCYLSLINPQSVMAWSAFYLFQATSDPLPWISCDNGYGKLPNGSKDNELESILPVEGSDAKNWHTDKCREFYADTTDMDYNPKIHRLPGSEYLRGRVQRMWRSGFSDENYNYNHSNGDQIYGIGQIKNRPIEVLPGILEFNLDTIIALIFSVFINIITATRGVKLNLKFLAVCIYVPYVVLTLLFFRATGLPGAWSGLYALFKPNASRLLHFETWLAAGEQVLFSAGCGVGVIATLGSHTPQDRDILFDASVCTAVNSLTSLMACTVVFMFLGHIQHSVSNVTIDSLIASGPELVFEVMSDLLGTLAKANYYVITFYILLFLLAYTVVVESFTALRTAFFEVLPVSIKYFPSYRTAIYVAIILFSTFSSALNLSKAGLHFFNFLGVFSNSLATEVALFLFLIGNVWIWGLQELVDAGSEMGNRTPGIYFQICWKFVAPIFCALLIIGLCFKTTFKITGIDAEEIVIPIGVEIVGIILSFGPLLVIPIGAIHAISKSPGKTYYVKFLCSISPPKDHRQILATKKSKRTTAAHYFYLFAAFTPNSFWEALQFFYRGPKFNQVAPTPIPSIFIADEDEEVIEVKRKSPEFVPAPPALGLGHAPAQLQEKYNEEDRPHTREKRDSGQSHASGKGHHQLPHHSALKEKVDEGPLFHHKHIRGSVEEHHKAHVHMDEATIEDNQHEEPTPAEEHKRTARKSKKVGGCATQ